MTPEDNSAPPRADLRDIWELRNAAAATLVKSEEQVRRLLDTAGPRELTALLDSFSPARSPGPDWTRSLEPLIERLWLWCDPQILAVVESAYRERGPAWLAVANFLAPDHGAAVRSLLVRHSQQARLPAMTIA